MATTADTVSTARPRANKDTATIVARVRVWDAPTRLFHWTVVGLVGTSWVTAENGLIRVHLWSGAVLLTLLIFRIGWGFWGSTTARFNDFVASPKSVIGYLRALLRGAKPLHAGHNPAGGWMVVTLLTLLIVQATTGLFANDDIHFNGPLAMLINKDASDGITDLHGILFNIVLLLVWLHLVAVFFYRLVKGEDLIGPMVTGTKPAASVPPGATLRFARLSLAVLLLASAAAIVWWVVRP